MSRSDNNRIGWLFPALIAVALAGCGESPADRVVATCKAAVAERLAGKTWSLVDNEWKGGFQQIESGVAEIVAPVYFDKGLPAESKQTVTCRVQLDVANAAAEPSVIGLVFQW